MTPNVKTVKPWITDDDIEAQLQKPQCMDPNGKSDGYPSTELYPDEDESLGKEIVEGREWDRDDILVFVSPAVQVSLLPRLKRPVYRLVSSRLQSPFSSWRATNCCHPT